MTRILNTRCRRTLAVAFATSAVATRAFATVALATIALATAALAAAGSTLAAQQRPDFSGVWTLATESATGTAAGGRAGEGGRGAARAGDMGSGWGSPLTIAQDANRMTVEYPFFVRTDMQPPLKFAYALDGSETRNSVMMGRGIQEQRSKAAWTANSLVVTTLHEFVNPQNNQSMTAEVRQSLLMESPTSLVVETTRVGVGGAPSNTTKSVYVKR